MVGQSATPKSWPLTFELLADRPVVVQSADVRLSSDAGLLPLREFDRQCRLTERMAQCLSDTRRDPEHTLTEMLRQRLFGILADYEDCNDHQDLRTDPIFQLLAGRTPGDAPLASQPTLSRFENSITPAMLRSLLELLVTTGIEQLQAVHGGQLPESVTLDIDPTDIQTHGAQQLTLFHGYYDQYQYFPQLITEPTTQHVFWAHLRHGTMHPSKGADDDLGEVVSRLRAARPDIAIHIRGDSGLAAPHLYQFCEENGLSYTLGLTSNRRLTALAEALMQRAVDQFETTGEKQRLLTTFDYQADSWDRPRTVIAKAECSSAGTNLRFVVTNLWVGSDLHAAVRYDDYIQRGASEQRNDELKNGLSLDRLSCHRFLANFWRLLLHTFAYNLLNALRQSDGAPEELRRAQPATWRTRLIKVAARVTRSTRRILVELSTHWPHWGGYESLAGHLLATARAP